MLGELGRSPGSVHQKVSGCISTIRSIYMDILDDGRQRGGFAKEMDPILGFSMILGGVLFMSAHSGESASGFSFQNSVAGPSSAYVAEGMASILNLRSTP